MTRHFGLSRRPLVGGVDQAAGSLHDSATLPQGSVLSPAGSTLERRKIGKPSFDERELGAGFLFFAMVIAPLVCVGLIVFCHRTLVP